MKKIVLTLLICLAAWSASSESTRLLLIGQSYWTAGGRADKIMTSFLNEAGCRSVTVETQRGTPRAAWYCQMFDAGKSDQLMPSHRSQKTEDLSRKDMSGVDHKLKQEWDMLVFHGLSGDAKEANALERFNVLIDFIRERDDKTPLYIEMTWPKKESDFDLYKKIHRHLSVERNLPFIPTGVAFERVLAERPDIALYRTPSDHHPSIRGQYLQSCMVFAALTGKSPVGLPGAIDGAVDGKTGEAVELDAEIAEYIQTVVWDVWQAEQQLAREPDYGKMD